jgi:hypothetical protein
MPDPISGARYRWHLPAGSGYAEALGRAHTSAVRTWLPKEKEELRMSANEPLREEEVKQLILTFWQMQEEKAHLVDLMEVTAPDLEITAWESSPGMVTGA